MTYPDFEARWKPAGGAERANYSLFLQDLCDLIDVPRPEPTTDNPTQDAYVLERAVEFNDNGKGSTGRIDLYKRGCFVLETKQGTETPDQQGWSSIRQHGTVQRTPDTSVGLNISTGISCSSDCTP